PAKLSNIDFNNLGLLLNKNDLNGFYTYLVNRGYSYANWARGVANADTGQVRRGGSENSRVRRATSIYAR
ncbi:hypothetical protein ABWL39_19670, partial [Chitinivorax sp. PXF-14]|uniref:hypothetical protein n=1 Tax=Chitinivorax sp. PXF-14 TaxID=3230488 RepID=UPI003467DFBF